MERETRNNEATLDLKNTQKITYSRKWKEFEMSVKT